MVTTTEGTSKRKKKTKPKRCCSKAWSSVWQEMGYKSEDGKEDEDVGVA